MHQTLELSDFPGCDLQRLKENPAYITSILSEREYAVFQILLKSAHSLNIKQIQRKLAEIALLDCRKVWAAPAVLDLLGTKIPALSTQKKRSEALAAHVKTLREIEEYDGKNRVLAEAEAAKLLSVAPIQLVLTLAQGLGLSIQGEPTIKRATSELAAQGLIGRRLMVENEKVGALFFVNPIVRETLQAHKAGK